MPAEGGHNNKPSEEEKLRQEAEEIFSTESTTEENFFEQEKSKLKRILEEYGPTIDDLRLSLEQLRKGSESVPMHSEEAMRQYNRTMLDREFLEDFLSNYEDLSTEQKEQINADFQALLEENDQ